MVALWLAKARVLVFRILIQFRILIAFRILIEFRISTQKKRFALFNHRQHEYESNPPGSWGWFSKAHFVCSSPTIYYSLDFLDWAADFDISLLPLFLV